MVLNKLLTKLKAWDINKDGRIEKDEMDGMLRKMNIHLSHAELDEFFNIFHHNEKAKHIQERCQRRKLSRDKGKPQHNLHNLRRTYY